MTLLALLIAPAVGVANPLPAGSIVFGVGQETCRQWTDHRLLNKGERVVDKQWLAGFISGIDSLSVGLGAGKLARETDNFDLMAQVVDDYCVAHPSEAAANGAEDLWLKLNARASR